MGSGKLEISTQQLRDTATSIRSYCDSMQRALGDATKTIKGTTDSWKSGGAETLRGQFDTLAPKFNDFYDAVQAYATFLDNTANSYDAADLKLQQKAEELLNSGYDA